MKTLGFILILAFANTSFAQSPIETYKDLLLSVEQNVNYKPFKKLWKKEQTAWEEKVNNAKSVKELTESTASFANKVFIAKQVKMASISTENLKEQTIGLKNVVNLLKEDGLNGWSGLDEWFKKADDFIAAEQAKEDEQKQMQRFQFISAALKDFEKNFPKIFEDSKKGSFANSIEGKVLVKDGQKIYRVKQEFSKGRDEIITIDEDNIYTYHVVFDANNDEEIAQKIFEEFVAYLESNLPQGYAKTNMFDGKYVNKNRYVFEFKGESFSATAKRPSVSIGRLKDVPTVMVEIEEPVFK